MSVMYLRKCLRKYVPLRKGGFDFFAVPFQSTVNLRNSKFNQEISFNRIISFSCRFLETIKTLIIYFFSQPFCQFLSQVYKNIFFFFYYYYYSYFFHVNEI